MPKKDCCCALSVWTISGNGNIVAKPVCQSYVIISSIISSWVWHTFKRMRIKAGGFNSNIWNDGYTWIFFPLNFFRENIWQRPVAMMLMFILVPKENIWRVNRSIQQIDILLSFSLFFSGAGHKNVVKTSSKNVSKSNVK